MDSPENLPEQSAGGKRKKSNVLTILIMGIALIAAGWAVREMLYRDFDPSKFDTSPLPRPEINAPFITSDQAVVQKMVEIAELSPDDLVYDLGCGDGRIVIAAVAQSECRGVGIDIDPERIVESTENAKQQGVAERIEFREQDIFTVDLSEADAAMMYLTPWMLEKLKSQFDEMKAGARILTHDFWLEQVRPDQIEVVKFGNPAKEHGIYRYTTPLKRDSSMVKGKPPTQADLARSANDSSPAEAP